MFNKEKRCGGAVCLLLGLALMLCGAAVLLGVRDSLIYILPAPAATEDGELAALYEKGTEQLTGMSDALQAYAIGARLQGTGITSGAGKSVTVTLYAVGAGYFDTVHERLLQGRFVSETDVRRAERVIVLTDTAALTLFPGGEPVGQRVTLGGELYEVAGIIRGGRRVGEADEHVAYIPITAASADQLALQTLELRAKGKDEIGSAILMQDTLRAWKPGGSFYSTGKLKLGAAMPLRWLLLIVGCKLLMALLRRLNALAWGRVCHFAQELRLRYALHLLPAMAASAFVCLLGYAALAGATFLLARFSIAPLLVFTEWVPEVVVELSSLARRFWALNAANAAAARYICREVCAVELGQGLLHWGLMAALLGGALRGLPWLSRVIELPRMKKER